MITVYTIQHLDRIVLILRAPLCFTCKWPRPGPLCLIFSVLHLFCPQRHECPTFINIAALFQPESFFWKYRNIHINAKWVLKISFLKFLKYIYIFYYLYVYIDNACLNFSSIVINHEGVASLYSKKKKNSQENLPETWLKEYINDANYNQIYNHTHWFQKLSRNQWAMTEKLSI